MSVIPFDDTDGRVAYAGSWTRFSSGNEHQGSAAFTNEGGASATVRFLGNSITIYGSIPPNTIQRAIYVLDDQPPRTFTSDRSSAARSLVEFMSFTNLVDQQHNLVITNLDGSALAIDRIQITRPEGLTPPQPTTWSVTTTTGGVRPPVGTGGGSIAPPSSAPDRGDQNENQNGGGTDPEESQGGNNNPSQSASGPGLGTTHSPRPEPSDRASGAVGDDETQGEVTLTISGQIVVKPTGSGSGTILELSDTSNDGGNDKSSQPNVGGIVGGILGGLVVILALILVFVLVKKRKRRQRFTMMTERTFLG
ncbi:hypothetical protein CC1G_02583 [Coprinopsis cinerea okayama7|uniref:Uncharacterized protein n=1 Tax=Coprinopsis cinerea (strain Okayama-7 / 130 / ATCC MYA-4618 / FGSC 9003) TaxID=240176 RepID=A8PB83_COPC7|nr:hypothetical protein CC1G_02583 [Coprinopsis cinerea okayama7\|eukprot:XP_001840120.1 hypothetical protein CC1G_02583 [Coprinopsis cinerea okayama7\